jgi:short-subunit dehydrogenase
MTEPDRRLHDATALVTGASSGIGAEIARELVARGCGTVVLVARREARLRSLAEELGPTAQVYVADLTDPRAIAQMIQDWPRVDLLVNNAGFGWGDAFAHQVEDVDRLLRMVDLNCKAVVQLTAGWIQGMIDRERGWILNVGSIAGMLPIPYMAVYTGTKGFVHQFSEALRMELRGTGVCVHILAPGPVQTEFFHVSRPDAGDRPLQGLFIQPDRVARESLDKLLSDRPFHVPDTRMRLGFGLLAQLPARIQRPLARQLFGRAQRIVGRTS